MSTEYENTGRLTIILHSGSYDRVTNALSLAVVCLSMGMEAHILLTYQALKRFRKGHLEDHDETDPELLSQMQRDIASGKFHSIGYKLDAALEMGLKVYACTTAMATCDLVKEDLVDGVDHIMGLTTFMNIVRESTVNWYI